MQNIAFERHLNDYFVAEFDVSAHLLHFKLVNFCELQTLIRESSFLFTISNMLLGNKGTCLVPASLLYSHAHIVFGQQSLEFKLSVDQKEQSYMAPIK